VTSRITLLVADDHAPTRAQVRAIFEPAGFEVVAEASTAADAVEAALRHQPEVCLLDIHMPGDGTVAARRIAIDQPASAVVMLTVERDDEHLFNALRAGAHGYLIKGTAPKVMVNALRGVLRGEPALSPGLAMRIMEQFQQRSGRRLRVPGRGVVQLSAREAEVLELMRQGLTTAEIAQRTFVAPVTVRSHISSVLGKLSAQDRDEAVRLVQDR
jgi:two-component system, NarL family, nitrate/nitrite response regulator NarL